MITSESLRNAASLSPMSAGKLNAAADTIDALTNDLKTARQAVTDNETKHASAVEALNVQLKEAREEIESLKTKDAVEVPA